MFVAANLMGRTVTADGGGFRFDQEAPLRRGFAEFFFFLVKLAHTKHLTTALFFISFLALARKGHQILDLKVYFFPRYHNEARHFSQTGGSDAATRSDVENKWSVVCCLLACQLPASYEQSDVSPHR